MEDEALVAGWDPAAKLRAAISSLRGPALQWHQQTGHAFADWNTWEPALRLVYHVPLKALQWSLMVEGRLQLPGKSTRDYILDKNEIILRNPGGITPEADRIPMFMRSLLDDKLKAAFMAQRPNTVANYIAQLRTKEEDMTRMVGSGVLNLLYPSLPTAPGGSFNVTAGTLPSFDSSLSPVSANGVPSPHVSQALLQPGVNLSAVPSYGVSNLSFQSVLHPMPQQLTMPPVTSHGMPSSLTPFGHSVTQASVGATGGA